MRANATPLHNLSRGQPVRIRLLAGAIAVVCFLIPALAGAKIPEPYLCSAPSHVLLVGCGSDGAADPAGTITCVVRDIANLPIAQAMVQLDFAQTPDMQPSMVQPDPAVTGVYCSGGMRIVEALADMQGIVTFHVVGSALRTAASGAHGPTLNISANGVILKTAIVSAFDQDGVGGVGPADLTDFLQDFFSGQYWARSDYDGDGTLGPNDLSLWVKEFFSANSVKSGSTALCP